MVFYRIYILSSDHSLVSSCPLVALHRGPGPRAGSMTEPWGCRAGGDGWHERGLSYDWLCAGGGA